MAICIAEIPAVGREVTPIPCMSSLGKRPNGFSRLSLKAVKVLFLALYSSRAALTWWDWSYFCLSSVPAIVNADIRLLPKFGWTLIKIMSVECFA